MALLVIIYTANALWFSAAFVQFYCRPKAAMLGGTLRKNMPEGDEWHYDLLAYLGALNASIAVLAWISLYRSLTVIKDPPSSMELDILSLLVLGSANFSQAWVNWIVVRGTDRWILGRFGDPITLLAPLEALDTTADSHVMLRRWEVTIAFIPSSVTAYAKTKYNWDPLNFAFTAALGVLALIIAGLTIFQGLLAAGPGRIKASKKAIGAYHVYTKNRFDTTELALRTTTQVPLITWELLYHRIVRKRQRPDVAEAAREKTDWDVSASWLNLLNAAGLHDVKFFGLISRATDYLPNDVQAAPAAGELRCLAILAAIADNGTDIQRHGRFLKVTGERSQLTFREHPSLGLVAAYERYSAAGILLAGESSTSFSLTFGTSERPMQGDELDQCLQLASGRLSYRTIRLTRSVTGFFDPQGFLVLLKDLREHSGNCGHALCEHGLSYWESIFSDRSKETWFPFLGSVALVAGDAPDFCRAFPWARYRMLDRINELRKCSTAWSKKDTQTLDDRTLECRAFLSSWATNREITTKIGSSPWAEKAPAPQSNHAAKFPVPNLSKATSDVPRRPEPHRSKTNLFFILGYCRLWLPRLDKSNASAAATTTLPVSTVAKARDLAPALGEIDAWLHAHGGSQASCLTLSMIFDLAGGRHKSFADNLDSSDGIQNSEAGLPQSLDGFGKISLEDKLSAILVFRGVVLAAMLCQGADTSMLYEDGFQDSIVKIL